MFCGSVDSIPFNYERAKRTKFLSAVIMGRLDEIQTALKLLQKLEKIK